MQSSKFFSFLNLFSSLGTLVCCALPALLVSLGLGAVMAGLASTVPGLIWVSEHKNGVFIVAGALLFFNSLFLWANRNASCPIDRELREACISGRRFSRNIYIVSLIIFLTGYFFAYLAKGFIF